MSNGNTPKNSIEKEGSFPNPPDDSLNDSENEAKQVWAVTSKFDDKLRTNVEHGRDKQEPSGSRNENQQEPIQSNTKTEAAQRETCTKLLPNQKAILSQRETCTKLLPHSNKKNNVTVLDFTPTSNETCVKTVPSSCEKRSSEIQMGETNTKFGKSLPIFQVNQKDVFKATHPKIEDMSSVKIIKAGRMHDQIKLQKIEENRSNYDNTKERLELAGYSELQRYLLSKMAKLQGANIGVAISPQGGRVKSPYGVYESKQIDKLTFRDLKEEDESIEAAAATRKGLINNEYQCMKTDFSSFKGEKDMQRTDFTSFNREKQKQKHGSTYNCLVRHNNQREEQITTKDKESLNRLKAIDQPKLWENAFSDLEEKKIEIPLPNFGSIEAATESVKSFKSTKSDTLRSIDILQFKINDLTSEQFKSLEIAFTDFNTKSYDKVTVENETAYKSTSEANKELDFRKSQNTQASDNKIGGEMKDVHDDLERTEPIHQVLEIMFLKRTFKDISDFNLFNGSKKNEILIETDFINESRSGCVPECGKDPTKYFRANGPIEIEKEPTYYLATIKELTDISEIAEKSILIAENEGNVIEEFFVEEAVEITFEIAKIRRPSVDIPQTYIELPKKEGISIESIFIEEPICTFAKLKHLELNLEQQKQLGVAFQPKEGILIETHYDRPPPPFHDPPRHYIAKVATLAEYDYIYEKVHREKKIKKTEIHRVHLTNDKGETQHSQQLVTKDETMKYINRCENMEQDKNSAVYRYKIPKGTNAVTEPVFEKTTSTKTEETPDQRTQLNRKPASNFVDSSYKYEKRRIRHQKELLQSSEYENLAIIKTEISRERLNEIQMKGLVIRMDSTYKYEPPEKDASILESRQIQTSTLMQHALDEPQYNSIVNEHDAIWFNFIYKYEKIPPSLLRKLDKQRIETATQWQLPTANPENRPTPTAHYTQETAIQIHMPPENNQQGESIQIPEFNIIPKTYKGNLLSLPGPSQQHPNVSRKSAFGIRKHEDPKTSSWPSITQKQNTITCPNCNNVTELRATIKNTENTHLMAIMLAPLLLCFVPYVLKKSRKEIYKCAFCNATLSKPPKKEQQ